MLNKKLIELIDIHSKEFIDVEQNMVDIEIEDNHLFCLGDGIISHNSAASAVQGAKSEATLSRYLASYPLKGKLINVNGFDMKKLLTNEEFTNIRIITGLQLGTPANECDLRYGKIATMTDADCDGHHISGLFFNMIYAFWPEAFEMGLIYRFRTPLIKATTKKEVFEFFTQEDFDEWKLKNKNVKFTSKFYKGLGTSKTSDFVKYLNDMDRYLVPITIEDVEDSDSINLAFGKEMADARKEWLALK